MMFFSTYSQSEEIIQISNGEWPPYTSEKLRDFGLYSHIVSKAFALENISVEYRFFPWARSYRYVEKGVFDASLTWAPTPDKKKQVIFSDPVFMHKKVFFHLKSTSFDWKTINDLKAFSIGATSDYTYGSEFDTFAKEGSLQVEYVSNDIQNFRRLLSNRIQIFPSDIDVGFDLINTYFTPEQAELFTYHPLPVQETYTCVIFTKKNPQRSYYLMTKFNEGLKKLKQSGKYNEMIKRSHAGEYILH